MNYSRDILSQNRIYIGVIRKLKIVALGGVNSLGGIRCLLAPLSQITSHSGISISSRAHNTYQQYSSLYDIIKSERVKIFFLTIVPVASIWM